MIVPYQHRGPGTPYNAFGELRGPARTQDEIRAYLAEGVAIAEQQREAKLTAMAPVVGEAAITAQEIHGAGAAEQVVVSTVDVAAQLSVARQAEVA